jgi:F0F1-type ATP synthase membrane subunit b/b'
LNQARQLVEAERNRRLDAIRREFASRVVAHAEQILRGQVDVEVDKVLRGAALENEKGIGMLTS